MKSEIELAEYFQKSDKFDILCRLCLRELIENSVSLFDVQENVVLAERVMMCARIHIQSGGPLPSHVCEQCFKELIIADAFRVKCQQSDAILKKVYAKYASEDKVTIDLANPPPAPRAALQEDAFKEENQDFSDLKVFKVENTSLGESKSETLPSIVNAKLKGTKRKQGAPARKLSHKSEERSMDVKEESQEDAELDQLEAGDYEDSDFESDFEANATDKRKHLPGKMGEMFCSLCNKSLSSRGALERHLRKVHSEDKKRTEKKFHCPDCDYKTHRRQAIVYHLHTHTGAKPFKCDECERSFSQPSTLKVHKKIHSDKMYFTCAECGKQFKYRKVYRTHMLVHSTERNYVCTICSRALKTPSALKVHMRRHNNIKNYACEACGATFVTGEELRSHVRIHTNKAKKYRCNLCNFSTNEKKKLEIHLKRHAGDRSVSCEVCDFACYAPHELRLHMRKHTKEQNYSCPECELKFRHSSSVNKHMLKAHGKKYKWGKCVDRRTVK